MNFDPKPFIECAEILVKMDETERALHLLSNLPGIYRDKVPKEIKDLKNLILSKITLPHDLLSDSRELPKSDEWSIHFLNNTMRGMKLKTLVKALNDEGKAPHIDEFGPGDGTFVIGMDYEKLKFTYSCTSLNEESKNRIYNKLLDKALWSDVKGPRIFVAYEIIEHLHNTEEIRQVHNRMCPEGADYVLLSTPTYCFEQGTPNWKTEKIHHLRTYGPREFLIESMRLFPEYQFQHFADPVQVVLGMKVCNS